MAPRVPCPSLGNYMANTYQGIKRKAAPAPPPEFGPITPIHFISHILEDKSDVRPLRQLQPPGSKPVRVVLPSPRPAAMILGGREWHPHERPVAWRLARRGGGGTAAWGSGQDTPTPGKPETSPGVGGDGEERGHQFVSGLSLGTCPACQTSSAFVTV